MDVGANGSFRHVTGYFSDTGMMAGNIKHVETVVCCKVKSCSPPFVFIFLSVFYSFNLSLSYSLLSLSPLFLHGPLKAKVCSRFFFFSAAKCLLNGKCVSLLTKNEKLISKSGTILDLSYDNLDPFYMLGVI